MEIAALALAALALVVAFTKRGGVSATELEDAKQDARRRVENLAREVEQGLEANRKLLAEVAAGAKLEPDQILEGRLWRDVPSTEGVELVAKGIRVLDVRTPLETANGVIPGSLLIPIDQLEDRMAELPKDGKPLLITCAAGGRSAAACEFLSTQGFTGLLNLEGGMSSWTGPVARA